MRRSIAIFTLALVACGSPESLGSTDAASTSSSALEQHATPEQSETEIARKGDSTQRVYAFGGTIVGSNVGEFGGEIKFQEPDGASYDIISDNSAGVFAMPYGVVAFTGLAHLGSSRGAVHLITKAADSPVSATLLMQLPGAPCDVAKDGDSISMRIGYWEERAPNDHVRKYACYRLSQDRQLSTYECPLPEKSTCNPG